MEEAIISFERAYGINPADVNNITMMGFCYLELKQYKQAIETFSEAIFRKPDHSFALANRGLAKIKSKDVERGLSDVQDALNLNWNEPYAYRTLGIHYLETGSPSLALTHFQRAKALYPETFKINELLTSAIASLTH